MGHWRLTARFTALVLMLAAARLAFAAPPGYEEGLQAFVAGRYAEALPHLVGANAADPGDLQTREKLARTYDEIFKRTGLYFPEALEAWVSLYNAEVEVNPAAEILPAAHRRIGELTMRGGDYETALEYFDAFRKDYPGHPALSEVVNEIGVANYYLDNYEEAVSAFDEALKLDPANQAARFNQRSIFTRLTIFDQASVNGRLGHYDLALADLDNLLTMAPRYAPAMLKKMIYLLKLGRVDEAARQGAKTMELGVPTRYRFETLNIMGDIHREKGENERALWYYHCALAIDPNYRPTIEKAEALRALTQPAAPLQKPGGAK